ncbi:MAG: sugar ABC transporter permease [Anaerolineae bacterium]|nr:sugar ABC transporter permease [Anaerolineae bacterium]
MAVRAVARTNSTATTTTRRRNWLPYMLALPIILYEGIFVFLPIVQEIASSFTSNIIGGGPVKWVGLANYQRMFSDASFWRSMRVTLTYLAFVVIISVLAGLFSALLLNQRFRGRSLVRGVITLPWAFPDVPTVLVFLWLINPSFGVMNVIVRLIPGITENPKWLQDANLAMPIVIAISAWKAFPFYSLAILAALQAVSAELYEAGKVDGANTFQLFRYITLPGISPTLLLMSLLASIFAFRQYSLIYLTTGGGPGALTETLVIKMYNTAFKFFDFSYGATIGVAGFVVALAITIAYLVLQIRQSRD